MKQRIQLFAALLLACQIAAGAHQIFIPATTGVNPFNIPWVTPGNTIRVTGFGGQFLTQYEVLPRFHGDILPAN